MHPGFCDELWTFDANGTWTLKASNTASDSNTETHMATRYYATIGYVNGDVYLHGGGTSSVLLSDLWLFRPDTADWKFLDGPLTGSQHAVVNDTYVHPGARYSGIAWGYGSELWVTGGDGYINSGMFFIYIILFYFVFLFFKPKKPVLIFIIFVISI
jgi:hypothetical protein